MHIINNAIFFIKLRAEDPVQQQSTSLAYDLVPSPALQNKTNFKREFFFFFWSVKTLFAVGVEEMIQLKSTGCSARGHKFKFQYLKVSHSCL